MRVVEKERGFFIQGQDGKNIYVYCWDDVQNPRAVVQIFHGMAEHAGRYRKFTEFLNNNGFIVYADDHLGHGKTVETIEQIGYIGDDGFNRIIEDENVLTEIIKKTHSGLPVIILGHSFGSFVAQEYITRYGGNISGVILSGSAVKCGLEVHVGIIIATIQRMLFGDKKKSKLLDYLSFGTYNKSVVKPQSKFAWLSRDAEEVRKYELDTHCGTIFTIGFFYYFLKGLSNLYKTDKLKKIPQSLPIYICSGSADPVGEYGKSVKKLYEMYKGIGIKDLEIKLYTDARHEIINEVNREEVFMDILKWVNKHI